MSLLVQLLTVLIMYDLTWLHLSLATKKFRDFGQDADVILTICGSKENSCLSQMSISITMFRAASVTVGRGWT
jgi:hypothetical protein